MWNLIKYEIDYYKWLFIIGIVLILLINIGLTFDNRWLEAQYDFPGLRVIWFGLGIVVFFGTLLFNRRSGRLRSKTLLPITKYQIGLARWMSFFLFWIILLIILIIFYFLNNNSMNTNWFINLISMTGTIIIINSIPIFYSDFINTYFKYWEKIILGSIWVILFLCYIYLNLIFSNYFDFISPEFISNSRKSLSNLYLANTTTLLIMVSSCIIFIATLFTYNNRKTYID